MRKKVFLCFFVFTGIVGFSQHMQEGFNALETGKYEKAMLFFENILSEYPDNKTAQLCYGRALGLTGNPKKAIGIFTGLRQQYPSDFEIKLNYAESLLWDKQYEKAAVFYERLVTEDITSFPAILGYANTLSNLKKYPEALKYVNKSLQIQEGNRNALTSRKYIRLGYAYQLTQNKAYKDALTLLDANLKDFPNDRDTQLNKANIFLITNALDKAEKVYHSLNASSIDSIIALNGLSLVAHKIFKNKEALKISTMAKAIVEKYTEKKYLYLATQERYIQALLWNRKYKPAASEINILTQKYPNNAKVKSLKATHGMYTSSFNESIKKYAAILKKEPNSFDGNLGIANAYRAIGNDMKSYTYILKTLRYYNQQPDAEKLLKTVKKTHTPWVQHKTAFSFDNGNNESISTSLSANIPISTKVSFNANYTYRNTENSTFKIDATTNDFSFGTLYKFNGKLSLSSKIGVNTSNAVTTDYSQWTGELKLQTKPFKLQNLNIGYQRQLQNFNADLIDREIVMNTLFLNYTLNTNFNLGWYTQYIFTDQTDNNTRNLLFTSLYYKIVHRPIVKAGLNYQTISFKNQVSSIYFSPKKFHVVEIFAELINEQIKNWTYKLNTATGLQYAERDPSSQTFRIEGKLGYIFYDRFLANTYVLHSTIASATAAGFKYTELGFQLKWYFMKSPLFNKKIMALD